MASTEDVEQTILRLRPLVWGQKRGPAIVRSLVCGRLGHVWMGHTHSLSNSGRGVWRHTRDSDRADMVFFKKLEEARRVN